MIEKSKRYIFIALSVSGVLCVAAWLYAAHNYTQARQLLIQSAQQQAASQAEDLSDTLRNNLFFFRGIPEMTSHLSGVREAAKKFGTTRSPSSLEYPLRKLKWTSDAKLNDLSKYLSIAQHSLNAGRIFIVNAAGDCIVDSEWDKSSSAIGTNYADREWFQANMIGKAGMQYAVGKTTHVAGLFFSSPILIDKLFMGAVVTKVDITKLSNIFLNTDAYVADRNGVIILAHDKHIEMQLVPGSRISEFDARQRMSIYQKENFQSLPIQQVVDENISDLFLIAGEDSPHLLERRQLDEFGLTVFLENDLPELWSLEKERTLVFMILSIVGIFLTLFSAISIAYLKKIRQANIALLDSKESLRIAATAFETHDAIMITDANNKILKVNEAFQKISGYSAEEVIGKTPRIMSSGRHDEEFYNDMWSELLNRGSWLGEVWDRRKNGEIYPKWLAITAVKNESGETTEYVAIFSDITSRKKAEDEIHNLAFYDPLTQLPNRRLLLDRLRQALILSIRNKRNGAVLFIDLDKFKELNDSLGHEIGDLLLMQAATRILACVRESDTVARLGGDEFVVVLTDLKDNPNEAAAQSKQIGRKILDELGLVYVLANHECHSGGSIGIALFNEHSKETEDLLKEADIAMYQAKKAGRNTLRFFDPQMQEAILERVAFERDLNQAVAQNEFYLCYQGIVSSESKVVGAEALIRWRHAKRGIVSPAEFIPLAEETGLILMIGNWVLNTACAQLVEWAARPETSALTIAVNVSARQFKQDDFVTQVVEVLEQTGANPQRLKLELTESMLVSDVESTIAKMRSLKACGVSFSLDDFGTGYSSLAYLRQLPLDTLKIDQSFVRKIETDDSAVVICAATISLAHNLNLKVVAEGVENLAQSYFLSSVHKCDYLQGYQFSKPVPIEEFENFIKLNSGRIKI